MRGDSGLALNFPEVKGECWSFSLSPLSFCFYKLNYKSTSFYWKEYSKFEEAKEQIFSKMVDDILWPGSWKLKNKYLIYILYHCQTENDKYHHLAWLRLAARQGPVMASGSPESQRNIDIFTRKYWQGLRLCHIV